MTKEEAIERLKYAHFHFRNEINEVEMKSIAGTGELDEFDIAINALEENDKLKSELEQSVKLPCKLKDTVYEVVKCNDGETRIFEMKVCNVCEYGSFHDGGKKKFVWNIYMEDEKGFGYSYGTFYDFGKTIFLSREEAERSVKK